MTGKGSDTSSALGLLMLRLGTCGLLIVQHGWPKLAHFAERSQSFSDPLHVGSPFSLALTVFGEVVCAACVLLGFATRFMVIPILIQFGVIIFVVHGADPFNKRELAIMYTIPLLAIALLGPGRFSIDGARGKA
jgi:putative oxidoreductase